MREHTYPPDFEYVPREEVRAVMRELRHEVVELDRVLAAESTAAGVDHAAVTARLDAIETSARRLDRAGRATNHPLLEPHLDGFRTTVERARRAAALEPPMYFLAGSVTGACLVCHGGD